MTDVVVPLLPETKPTASWPWRLFEAFWSSGHACLLTAPLLLFCSNLTVSALTQTLPAMEVLLLRSMLIAMSLCLSRWIQRGGCLWTKGEKLGLVVLHTVSAVCTSVTAFAAISLLPLADALTLIYTNIAATAILGWIFGLEKIRWYGFIGAALCIGGLFFVIQPSFIFGRSLSERSHSNRTIGLILAVTTSLLTSVTLLFKRAIGTSQRPDVLCLYSAVAVIPIASISVILGIPSAASWQLHPCQISLIVLNALSSIFATILINRGIALVSGTLGAIASSFQLLLAHATDVFLMKEAFCPIVLVGSVFMFLGSILTIKSLNR